MMKLPKYAKNALSTKLITSLNPNPNFDGLNDFSEVEWDMNNEINGVLPKGRNIEYICETVDGRLAFVYSTSVIEIGQMRFKVHPSKTAPWWAKMTTRVHVVSIKSRAWDILFHIDGWSGY